MQSADVLIRKVHQIDGRSYGHYKQLVGAWDYGRFTFHIDRVQSDPFAPPSAVRIEISLSEMGLEKEYVQTAELRLAVGDFLARRAGNVFARANQGGGKSQTGLRIAKTGQEILARSSVQVSQTSVQLRLQCPFPARGRTILGHRFADFLDFELETLAYDALAFTGEHADQIDKIRRHCQTYLDYLALREQLKTNHWVAFIAQGAILARESGISDRPLNGAVPFNLPDCYRGLGQSTKVKQVQLPYAGKVTGLAIETGITLLVGGGYHGKSTLLQALERGVYSHIPGDGRELVATDPTAMKIRAQDGRAVTGVDISLFINHLPQVDAAGQPLTDRRLPTGPNRFSTDNASGSTSQAATIIESLEAGCRTLLIDEDTSATNLLIRDQRMRHLVQSEPITPLLDRIRQLWENLGVSTIMVMGGAGDYLDPADQVFLLDHYQIFDATRAAKEICAQLPTRLAVPGEVSASRRSTSGAATATNSEVLEGKPNEMPSWPELPFMPRKLSSCAAPNRGKRERVKAHSLRQITLNYEEIDLSAIAQIVDSGQAEAIAWMIKKLTEQNKYHGHSWQELANILAQEWEDEGFASFAAGRQPAFLVQPRWVDVLAALNQYRRLQVK